MEDESGLCKFTIEPPFQHTPETRLAWRLYKETVNLSGLDSQNLPSIDRLEAVLMKWNLRMTRDEAASLIDMLSAMHTTIRSGLQAKQQRNG